MSKTRIPKNPTDQEFSALARHKNVHVRHEIAQDPRFKPTELEYEKGFEDPIADVRMTYATKAIEAGIGLSLDQRNKVLSQVDKVTRAKDPSYVEWECRAESIWQHRQLKNKHLNVTKAQPTREAL